MPYGIHGHLSPAARSPFGEAPYRRNSPGGGGSTAQRPRTPSLRTGRCAWLERTPRRGPCTTASATPDPVRREDTDVSPRRMTTLGRDGDNSSSWQFPRVITLRDPAQNIRPVSKFSHPCSRRRLGRRLGCVTRGTATRDQEAQADSRGLAGSRRAAESQFGADPVSCKRPGELQETENGSQRRRARDAIVGVIRSRVVHHG
jgi:hypothetical protein